MGFANSFKRVFNVQLLAAHAKRKYEATGVDYPKRTSSEEKLRRIGLLKRDEHIKSLFSGGSDWKAQENVTDLLAMVVKMNSK